jgi:hypothetical protein
MATSKWTRSHFLKNFIFFQQQNHHKAHIPISDIKWCWFCKLSYKFKRFYPLFFTLLCFYLIYGKHLNVGKVVSFFIYAFFSLHYVLSKFIYTQKWKKKKVFLISFLIDMFSFFFYRNFCGLKLAKKIENKI